MKNTRDGKTKIVCTIGPSSGSVDMLAHLIGAGMDVARLNFSHGTYDEHRSLLGSIREASARTEAHVTVVQDLQGPKIRIGEFAQPSVDLRRGERFTITTDEIIGDATRVATSFKNLPKDTRPGEMVLLDDGKIRLRVLKVKGKEVVCEVVVGGTLSAHKGINLPGTTVRSPSLTEKDLRDLEFGLESGVDYVALSFVRTADDINALRKAIAERTRGGLPVPVVAKIEKPQAVTNIEEIISASDIVMVARGDLGVELPPEDVPVLQKRIVGRCNASGKPVIIATQMLESMIGSPTPTRAEASDVANAVLDGADAVMLSAETSVGKYPLEAVKMMERIIRKAESEGGVRMKAIRRPHEAVENRLDALGQSACVLAEQMKAAAIVAVTHTGSTARAIARYRPERPIIAISDDLATLRRLNIVWGVRGVHIGGLDGDSDKALQHIQEELLAAGLVRRGAYVVLLAGQPFFGRGSTNFIKVEQIV